MAKENSESVQNAPNMPKDEIIGYHKGSINTLLAERNELLKMAGVTENLIQAHAQELQKLGVNIGTQQERTAENTTSADSSDKYQTKKKA